MKQKNNHKILGIILAGGKSQRMGGDKTFLYFNGKTLVEHCLNRLRLQLSTVIINSNRPAIDFQALSTPIVSDTQYGGAANKGPLGGLLAGLNYGKLKGFDAVITIAVDTPFFPKNLINRFLEQQPKTPDKLKTLMAKSNAGLQPTFAFWPVEKRITLANYLKNEDNYRIKNFASLCNADDVFFDNKGDLDPFFNINQPVDFKVALAALQKGPIE